MHHKPALVWGIHHSLSDLGNEKPATRVMLRIMARMSPGIDHITYCSQVARQQHRRIGFSDRNDTLIPNAIDCSEFRPDPHAAGRLRALCGIGPDTLLVGNVARAHPMKDHVSLVRAFALLRERGMDVHLVLIGNGHAGGPAEAEAQRLGIAPHLTTLPARSDIAQLVPGLDLFALSSAWGEAQSLALGEAMASCVPCVTTDMGDCAWMVGDARLVVPPAQPAALADAMARVLALPPDARRQIGREARQRVESQLSLDVYTSDHAKAYRAATAHRLSTLSEVPT